MRVSPRRLAGRLPGSGRLRRIGDRFVRDRVDPELAALRTRIDELEATRARADELAAVRARVDELGSMRALLDEHETSRHEHWVRLGDVAGETGRLRDDLGGLRFDIERIIPVVAALEERMERLQRSLPVLTPRTAPDAGVPAGTPDGGTAPQAAPATAEVAGHLLTEIRREHAQVRARLSAVAAYEERLRRLEAG